MGPTGLAPKMPFCHYKPHEAYVHKTGNSAATHPRNSQSYLFFMLNDPSHVNRLSRFTESISSRSDFRLQHMLTNEHTNKHDESQ